MPSAVLRPIFPGAIDRLALLHNMLKALHREIVFDPIRPTRPPPRRKPSRSSAASARTSATFSLPLLAVLASRHVMYPAIFAAPMALSTRRRAMPDRGLHSRPGLGRLRPDQRHQRHRRASAGCGRAGSISSAAPVRGTRYGGSGEDLTVQIRVDQALRSVTELGQWHHNPFFNGAEIRIMRRGAGCPARQPDARLYDLLLWNSGPRGPRDDRGYPDHMPGSTMSRLSASCMSSSSRANVSWPSPPRATCRSASRSSRP